MLMMGMAILTAAHICRLVTRLGDKIKDGVERNDWRYTRRKEEAKGSDFRGCADHGLSCAVRRAGKGEQRACCVDCNTLVERCHSSYARRKSDTQSTDSPL